ncbi:hypothetical protein FACS189473_0740 [Spirochaetia bacterium]|nr:hypothetical protein FACS189473_0740 [Spirochaetia bacterium]
MNYTARQERIKGEPYDYAKDFMILTGAEKRAVLEKAKTLLKLQKENTGAPVSPPEAEKRPAPGVNFG